MITSTIESSATMAIVVLVIGFALSKLKFGTYLSVIFTTMKNVCVWKKGPVAVSNNFSSTVQGKIDIINRKRSSEAKSKRAPVKINDKHIIEYKHGFIVDWCPMFRKTTDDALVSFQIETRVKTKSGQWCRLCGPVVEMEAWPSIEKGTRVEDLIYSPNDPDALNGKVVVSHAILDPEYHHIKGNLPFKKGRLYKITHVANESMKDKWRVSEIEDVTKNYPRNKNVFVY